MEAKALQRLVPPELPVDTFDASAWIAITPFRVSGFRLRGTFPLPVLSTFLELNVRTYVTLDDKPGIYFFSLDAESALAVEAARRIYSLPYFRAAMWAERRGSWLDYSSTRKASGRPHVFHGRYRGVGPERTAKPGSLEHFLTERYCLYTLAEQNVVARADIHHRPWQLQDGEAELRDNSMAPDGIELESDPILHFAERQDVVIWGLEALRSPE